MPAHTLLTLVAKIMLVVTIDQHTPAVLDLGDGPPITLVEVIKNVEGLVHLDRKTYFEPTETTLRRYELLVFERISDLDGRETWRLVARQKNPKKYPSRPRHMFAGGTFY